MSTFSSIPRTYKYTEGLKKLGRPPIMAMVEKDMVDYIIYRYDHGFGMKWPEVRQLAREVALSLAASLPDGHGLKASLLEFRATHKWVLAFRKRHENLTSRRPQLYQAYRAAMSNEKVVEAWVQLYLDALVEVDRLSGGDGKWENVGGAQIVNIDESGFTTHPQPGGMVAAPAGRRECQVVGSEHGTHVSALFALAANGRCSSPFFIIPGKVKVSKELEHDGSLKGVEDGHAYAFADKGNMTSEVRACLFMCVDGWVDVGECMSPS